MRVLKTVNVTKGEYLVKEGEEAKSIFIIREGEVLITKNIDNHSLKKKNIEQMMKAPIRTKRI